VKLKKRILKGKKKKRSQKTLLNCSSGPSRRAKGDLRRGDVFAREQREKHNGLEERDMVKRGYTEGKDRLREVRGKGRKTLEIFLGGRREGSKTTA